MPNPFFYGGMVTDPDKFFGREAELRTIFGRLSTTPSQCVSVVGERRIGKSSLLYHLTQVYPRHLAEAERYLFAYIDLQSARCQSGTGLLTVILKKVRSEAGLRLGTESRKWFYGLREKAPEGRMVNLETFEEVLKQLSARNYKPVVCLDEFEELIESPQEFDDSFFDSWRSVAQFGHIAFVTASQTPLEVLSRSGKLTSPFFNIFAKVPLGELKPDEARELITQPSDRPFAEEEVKLALKLAGCHPFHLQIACSTIYEEKAKGEIDVLVVRKAYEAAVKSVPLLQKMRASVSKHWSKLVEGGKYLVEVVLRLKGK
jgi:AAA+ ATPase superfamily predicted ATPase